MFFVTRRFHIKNPISQPIRSWEKKQNSLELSKHTGYQNQDLLFI